MQTTACQNEIPKDFLLLTQETRLQFFLSPWKRQRLRQMISTPSPSEHKVFSLYSVTELQLKVPVTMVSFVNTCSSEKMIRGLKKKKKRERNPPKLLTCNYGNKQLVVTNTSGQQGMHDIETNVSMVH